LTTERSVSEFIATCIGHSPRQTLSDYIVDTSARKSFDRNEQIRSGHGFVRSALSQHRRARQQVAEVNQVPCL
jgi:hypothetical protein